jgi:hypothetical protein
MGEGPRGGMVDVRARARTPGRRRPGEEALWARGVGLGGAASGAGENEGTVNVGFAGGEGHWAGGDGRGGSARGEDRAREEGPPA